MTHNDAVRQVKAETKPEPSPSLVAQQLRTVNNTGRIKAESIAAESIASESTTPADVAGHMLEILESKIALDRPPSLSKKREAQLNFIAKHVFGSNLARWSEFVDRIADSEYLKAKVSREGIDWAITPENCLAILEGDYPDAPADEADDGNNTNHTK